MAILLPTLVDISCGYVQACGRTIGTGVQASPKTPGEVLIARYRKQQFTNYLRLIQTGTPVAHVHVDLANRAYFGGRPPKTTHKKADFDKALEAYLGCKIDLYFRAQFFVLRTSLPPDGLILAGHPKTTPSRFKGVRLLGARYQLDSGPVDFIEWEALDEVIIVDIVLQRPSVISDTYLVDTLEVSYAAYQSFVLSNSRTGESAASPKSSRLAR